MLMRRERIDNAAWEIGFPLGFPLRTTDASFLFSAPTACNAGYVRTANVISVTKHRFVFPGRTRFLGRPVGVPRAHESR